jgi:oxalate---CoA ligase
MNHQTTVNGEFQRYSEPQTVPSPQVTIGTKIRQHAETQPDHPAMVSSGFAPLSYRELQSEIGAVRGALRRAGFDRTARIAVAMPNGPQTALAIVAVSCSAVCVPLNPRQTLPETEKCLAAIRPDAVLLMRDEESAAREAAAAAGMTIIEVAPANAGVLKLDIAAPPAATVASSEPDEPASEAPAFILQTSGTTADSKLIPTSHRNMLAAAARVQVWFNLTPQDRCLSASPVFYAHGLHVTVFAVLLSGGTIAFPADAFKLDFGEWFGALRPTWYSAGPTLHRLVLDQIKSRLGAKEDHALRFVVSGGAPLPPDVQDELRRVLNVPVLEHYGSSEGMQICANQLPPGQSKPGTCGVPWPNTIKIVGEDRRELPSGELGEILISGPTVVSGYLNAPELTCACFIDGWFKSGDVGSIDADGFLTLHGRKDDLINRGGEKISPLEIDEALGRHPAVAEAAAFAVPHVRLGQDVAAAVVLRPGLTASPLELRSHLRDRIAAFKIPRRIVICDQLPKGATGKVLRRLLADSLQGALAAESTIAAPQPIEDESVDRHLVMQLTALWERLLQIAPISLDDDFFEKGGDSLLAMDMLAELELLTGGPVSASALLDASTIRQLARKLAGRNLEANYLVSIHPEGRRRPLVLFHGDYLWGGGPLTVGLANRLGADQPILTVVPHGAGNEAIPRSIEVMAAERLPLIMKAQPEGPYRLCGICLGGIVAFEVARLLRAAGKEVEMVFMVDPPTINARKSMQWILSGMKRARPFLGPVVDRTMARTWYRSTDFQKFWNVSWARRWAAIKNLLRSRGAYRTNHEVETALALAALASKPDAEVSPLGRFTDARTAEYAAAMSNYIPRPLAVRVIYISVDYGIGGWRRISPDLEFIKLPGSHYHIDVAQVAVELGRRLVPRN